MNTIKKLKTLVVSTTIMTICMLSMSSQLMAQAPIKGDATDEVKQKIQTMNSEMEQAFKAGDMVKVAEFYADDAVLIIPGGKKLNGKKAIYEYLSGLSDTKDIQLSVSDVNGSGKIIYQLGTFTFSADMNGVNKKQSSDQVKVWKRGTDWDYKISVDSFN